MKKKWIALTQKGFTLLEMMVVLFIISLLLLLFIPNVGTHQEQAQSKGNDALHQTLQTQVDLYKFENGGNAPESFKALEKDYLSEEQVEKADVLFILSNGKVSKREADNP